MKRYILLSAVVFVALSLNAKDAHKVFKVKSEKIINPFGGKVPDFVANKRTTKEAKRTTEEAKRTTEKLKVTKQKVKWTTDIIAGD